KILFIFFVILYVLPSFGQRFPFGFGNPGFFRPPFGRSQLGGCRGQRWTDRCNNCFCVNGMPACTRRFCF
ncbi:hypothetical protein Avbf_18568, partial [Armadillidium vulgare]